MKQFFLHRTANTRLDKRFFKVFYILRTTLILTKM